MATYAQLADVEAATGKPIPVESAHDVEELLDEAEVQLAAYAGDLAERVIAELTTADRLRSAVVGMVVQALRKTESQQQLLAGSTTAAERSSIRQPIVVGRRERFLVGIPTAAWAVSVSDSDSTLRSPTRPALPRREGSRLWR